MYQCNAVVHLKVYDTQKPDIITTHPQYVMLDGQLQDIPEKSGTFAPASRRRLVATTMRIIPTGIKLNDAVSLKIQRSTQAPASTTKLTTVPVKKPKSITKKSAVSI